MPDPAVTAEQPVLPAETIPQEHLVALTLDKMNIVYVGIDNPLTLHYNGPDARDLRLIVSPSGKLSGGGQHYLLKVQEPGEVTLKVMSKGRELGAFSFRAKRLPDPPARVGSLSSGVVSMGEFEAQTGIHALIENLDIEARCQIVGYELLRFAKDGARSKSVNPGGVFSAHSQGLVLMAMPGDYYVIMNVKARCPGDKASRQLNSLAFEIR